MAIIDSIQINSTFYDIGVDGENVEGSVASAQTLDALTAAAALNFHSGVTDNIQSQIDKLNAAIVETNESVLRNSKASAMELISIKGNTYQNGTPSPAYPQSLNNVSDCVEMKQGAYIVADGNFINIANVITNKNAVPCKVGDVITLSTEKEYAYLSFVFYNEDTYISGISSGEKGRYFSVTVPAGANNFRFNIEGAYGVDTVTPETAGKIELTVNDKYVNCIKIQQGIEIVQGYLDSINGNYIDLNGFVCSKNYIPCNENDNITLILDSNDKGILFHFYNKNGYIATHGDGSTSSQRTTIVPSGATCFKYTIGNGSTTIDNVGKIILKINEINEKLIYFYTNESLKERDKVFKDVDGLWKIEYNTKEIVLDGVTYISHGNYDGSYEGYSVHEFYYNLPDKKFGLTNFISNKLIVESSRMDYPYYIRGYEQDSSVAVSIPMDVVPYSNLEMDLWLAKNRPIVQYELATPIYEVLDDEVQEAFNSLKSFNDVTYIDFDSKIKPEISFRYPTLAESARVFDNTYEIKQLNDEIDFVVNDIATTTSSTLKDSKTGGMELKVTGTTYQNKLSGKNIFNTDVLKSASAGGATVTKHGDGTFTISGSGTLTAMYLDTYKYSKEEAMRIINKPGYLVLESGNATVPYPVIGLYDTASGAGIHNKVAFTASSSKEIIEINQWDVDKIADGTYSLRVYIYASSGLEIKPGVVRPFAYMIDNINDLDKVSYEPYCGGFTSPNPNYPQPLLSTGECVELMQGYRNINTGQHTQSTTIVCAKDLIPCKFGDSIKLHMRKAAQVQAVIFNGNSVLGYYTSNTALNDYAFTLNENVFATATHFCFNLIFSSNCTPETAGAVQLTINDKYINCVKTEGKNLARMLQSNALTVLNVSFTNDKNTIYTKGTSIGSGGRLNYIERIKLPAGKYIVSLQNKKGSPAPMCLTDVSAATYVIAAFETYAIFELTKETTLGLGINVKPDIVYDGSCDIQIEKIDEKHNALAIPSSFVPYQEPTVAYFYTDKPMLKGSELYKEDGIWKVKHNTAETELDGDVNELWGYDSNNNFFYTNTLEEKIKIYSNLICSHYLNILNADKSIFTQRDAGYALWIRNDDYNGDVYALRDALNTSPIKVLYELATPIYETLDTDAQVALNSLRTFDNTTYIGFDSRVQPEVEVRYGVTDTSALILENASRTDAQNVQMQQLTSSMLALSQM